MFQTLNSIHLNFPELHYSSILSLFDAGFLERRTILYCCIGLDV